MSMDYDFLSAVTKCSTLWQLFGWKKYKVVPIACPSHPDNPTHILWLRGIEIQHLSELARSLCYQMTHRSDQKLLITLDIR